MRSSMMGQSPWLVLVVLLVSFITTVQGQKNSPVALRFRNAAKASPSNIARLQSGQDFTNLISTQRDYSVSLLLSALDSPPVECAPCKTFQPIYQSLAKGVRKLAKKEVQNQHLFAYLEFKDGREVFQSLKLQYAPALLYFPPTTGPRATSSMEPETFDFSRKGFEGEEVAEDLSTKLGVRITYSKPFPWQLVGLVGSSIVAIGLLLSLILPRLSATLNQTNADGSPSTALTLKALFGFSLQIGVLAFITIMCAGQMWNSIRNAPYVTADGQGKPQYFAAGFQNQNAAETQIVSVIYAILGFSTVALAILVPTQRDPVKQRAGVYVWSAILLTAFSLLLYVFRLKNASYPFRFLF